MNPDKRLDVKVSLVITDNDKPYHSSVVTWEDMPYPYVLDVQKTLIEGLAALNQLGYAAFEQSLSAANPPSSE